MSDIDRRRLLCSLAGAGSSLALTSGLKARTGETRDSDRIKAENQHEGTLDWQLTYTRIDPKTKCTSFGGGLGASLGGMLGGPLGGPAGGPKGA